jgi:5'-3' exoribonuclease 1
MGIPFYYRQIISKDQRKLLANLHDCDRLFLDFNSIIHVCAGSVIGKHKDIDNLEEAIFKEILNQTILVTTICKPTKLLYISIDGVAPRSKINQQRKRRFLSAYRNDIINKFKDNNNIRYIKWDSNAITPGTEFMRKLHEYLESSIAKLDFPFKIILSGSNEPGEGEQKIFEYMRNNKEEKCCNVIYGLDADLIMLSLIAEDEKIYLMREGQNFFNGMSDYKFLDIYTLRSCVSKYLYDVDNVSYMNDYVFICFLLGNDFIPNISCLKIKSGAVDILCDIYKKVHAERKENLVTKSKDNKYIINQEFFINFLEVLSLKEEDLIKETTEQYYNKPKATMQSHASKLDQFAFELDNYPTFNKFPLVINPSVDSSWKSNYYYHLFGSHVNENIKKTCQDYVEGLVWTVDYYFNGILNNSWYYKYNYAPCVADIYKYLKTEGIKFSKADNIAIDENIQLLMVLPPFSKGILKPEYQKIMEEIEFGCVHYYPSKFYLTSYMKTHLWECIPVLPNIDINRIVKAYEKLKTK